jgi:hypothetical protein
MKNPLYMSKFGKNTGIAFCEMPSPPPPPWVWTNMARPPTYMGGNYKKLHEISVCNSPPHEQISTIKANLAMNKK